MRCFAQLSWLADSVGNDDDDPLPDVDQNDKDDMNNHCLFTTDINDPSFERGKAARFIRAEIEGYRNLFCENRKCNL